MGNNDRCVCVATVALIWMLCLGNMPVACNRIENEIKTLKGYLPMKWVNNRFKN